MTDLYLWNAQMVDVDPTRFRSPETYLEAVRVRPIDTFSYIASRAASDAFFSDSQFVGLGLSTSVIDGQLRVMQVFPGSPAADASVVRGDRITEINNRSVAQLVAEDLIGSAFGTADVGAVVEIVVVDREAEPRRVRLTKRVVTIPTVSLTRVYEVAGRKVGYVFFRNFVEPSFAALDVAFAGLSEDGIDDLVLDLRYNGGGLVSVAQRLASLIGGVLTEGQVFAESVHNARNVTRNQILRFETRANAASLGRLIVITTRASASASELVINALRPFMPVVVVGDRTYGKPVGQYALAFCDKVLAPVSFSLRNADREGDYFQGFAPDCPAVDDAEHQLGDVGSPGTELEFAL